MKKKVAIIGSGIAGLSAAFFLRKDFEVTLFEKNNYPGGHSNTVNIEDDPGVEFDTGFMVFNHVTYPLLTKLFNKLEVDTYPTSMSFSVQHTDSRMEYCGSGYNGLFGQRRNIFSLPFWKLLISIDRFNMYAQNFMGEIDESITIGEFCSEINLKEDFLHKYLIPMSGAVWSTPPDKMLDFPAATLIRFFHNHGFLGLNTQHQWFTVKNGSRSYVNRLLDIAKPKVRLNSQVSSVIRSGSEVLVIDAEGEHRFDHCIIATHADTAAAIVKDLTSREKEILLPFRYQRNTALVHFDEAVMPERRRIWSSWNYRISSLQNSFANSTIYWMNNLQKLNTRRNYFVSIDDPGFVNEKKVIMEIEYHHPLFDVRAIQMQKKLGELNRDNLYFCGSYHRYGFHEDALMSSANVCAQLTNEIWN